MEEKSRTTAESGMTEQEQQKLLKKAYVLLNYSFVLTDVIDAYLMDTGAYLERLEVDAVYGKKRRLRAIRNQLKPIREQLKKITAYSYEDGAMRDVEEFCDDSDFLRDFLLLFLDRSGIGKKAQIHIRSLVRKEPSLLGIYDLLTENLKAYNKMVKDLKKKQ